ncbi:MAG: hypothetical protein Roseis2KO_10140 [Roseivirga sp.]
MTRYLLVISLLLNFSSQTSNTRHLGKWAGDDGVQSGFLILDEEGYATLKADGQVMGGKSAVVGGIEAYMLYTIDYQYKPIEIDFIIHRLADDQEMGRLKGIIEFMDDNTLKLAMGFSGDRPEDFEGDDTLVFTKEQ